MDLADKELLILSRPDLVENIDISSGLLTHLISRKVFSKRMVDNITYNKPPVSQIEELLDLLPKRGPDAFRLFCEALIATHQEYIVTDILKRGTSPEASSPSTSASPPAASVPVRLKTELSARVVFPTDPALVLNSLPSPALSQVSVSDPSPLSPSPLLDNAPSTPQKRKFENEATENEDQSCPSETDSSPTVIRIHGDSDNIIKIYSPLPDDFRANSRENKFFKFDALERLVSVPKFKPETKNEEAFKDRAFGSEEIRYVMKHFICKDAAENKGQEENVILTSLMDKYLEQFSSKHGPPSKMERESDFGRNILKERMLRCDSTDTMETRKPENLRLDVNKKLVFTDLLDVHKTTAEVAQPERSVMKVPASVLTSAPILVNSLDYTDGPLSVHVEECSRQFYNANKDKSYRMISMPRGLALIMNVNEVAEKPPRRGTDIDRDNLSNLLTQLHFQVTIYNDEDDLTALGMAEKLREFAARTEHEKSDACVICLLSHGEEGFMFGTDGKKIPLDEIFLLFDNRHCPVLLNKPKIFFIQACRGGMLDHGVKVHHDETDGGVKVHNNNNMVQHPSMSDMLICYPTLQGYYAWRNRERGSWYIEAVVNIFMKYAKCEDICAMLNRVNSDVSRKISRTPQSEMDRMSQMSEYKSSLRQPYLFFYPGIGAPSLT